MLKGVYFQPNNLSLKATLKGMMKLRYTSAVCLQRTAFNHSYFTFTRRKMRSFILTRQESQFGKADLHGLRIATSDTIVVRFQNVF